MTNEKTPCTDWIDSIEAARERRENEQNAASVSQNADALGYAFTLLYDLGAPEVTITRWDRVEACGTELRVDHQGDSTEAQPRLGPFAQKMAAYAQCYLGRITQEKDGFFKPRRYYVVPNGPKPAPRVQQWGTEITKLSDITPRRKQ